MSGFEADLKGKIRATKADVVISHRRRSAVHRLGGGRPKIAGSPTSRPMAYVESEVIIKHASNPAGMGIILRGMDARAPRACWTWAHDVRGQGRVPAHPEQDPGDDGDFMLVSAGGDGDPSPLFPTRRPKTAPRAGAPPKGRRRSRRRRCGKAGQVPGVLLGDELYSGTVRVFVGATSTSPVRCAGRADGPCPKLKPFRVAGHFYTGMYEFDSKLAYVALADAQRFLGTPGEVTGIEVRTSTPRRRARWPSASPGELGPGLRSGHGRSSTAASSPP